jgi:hypothetical protein
VGLVAAGNDQRGNVEGEELLGLRAPARCPRSRRAARIRVTAER